MGCRSLLETTENTRDLGGYPCTSGVTRRFSLLRSDIAMHPSERDLAFLLSYDITTIVDLREEDAPPGGFEGLPGLTVVRCPITAGSGVPASYEAVPQSYLDIAGSSGMAAALKTAASASGGVLFHCTAGKDRTGVMAAVLLMAAGVADKDIIADYLLTRDYAKGRLEAVHRQFPALDMRIVTPSPDHIGGFLRLFREKYGTVQDYLSAVGLKEAEADRLRQALLEGSHVHR